MHDDLVLRVREAWADVLRSDSAESVPVDANFLEVGGNSLLLVMLWEQLQPLAAHPLRLSELFQHGTVLSQAGLLSRTAEQASAHPAEQRRSLLGQRRAAAQPEGTA
ncbi:acyl carrier protein [Nonomuraea sp. NPDC004354]